MTSLRRAGTVMLALLAVLLVVDFTAWRWITGRMLTDYMAWRRQAESQGLSIGSAQPTRAGWPLAAQIVLVAAMADAGPTEWRADQVRLGLAPLHPRTLTIEVEGRQVLHVGGLTPVELRARRLAASVSLDASQPTRVDARDLRAEWPGGAAVVGTFAALLDATGVDATADAIALPGFGGPFGVTEHATARVRLAGLPRDGAVAAAAGACGGCQIVVDEATLRWAGPVSAQGRMTIGLDANRQPQAAGMVRVSGYREAIEALVAAGIIDRRAGQVAGTVLGLMAVSPPDGPAMVELPLTLANGTLAMGAVPLLRIPAMTWP